MLKFKVELDLLDFMMLQQALAIALDSDESKALSAKLSAAAFKALRRHQNNSVTSESSVPSEAAT